MEQPVFAVCWKPAYLRASVDFLTGEVTPDRLSAGVSPADEAALEWALRAAERWGGRVRLVVASGEEGDEVLRLGYAAGAGELVRVAIRTDCPSEQIARSLAPHVRDAFLVWCGDMSTDRGSGAVPAYLAGELGSAQALGLVGVEFSSGAEESPSLEALRRLDRGRRERVRVARRAVVSCEGATARLRRGPLDRVLAAREAEIAVHEPPAATAAELPREPGVISVGPFRPRARVVAPPPGGSARERIRSLTGVAVEPRTARAVTLDPGDAADAVLEALRSWGELP